MEVKLFTDANVFSHEAAAYLAADPFSANAIAVKADRICRGEPRGLDDFWATVTDCGRVVGLAMHTPEYAGPKQPRPLVENSHK